MFFTISLIVVLDCLNPKVEVILSSYSSYGYRSYSSYSRSSYCYSSYGYNSYSNSSYCSASGSKTYPIVKDFSYGNNDNT